MKKLFFASLWALTCLVVGRTERRVRINRRRMGISEERVLPERETGRQFHGRGRGGQSDCDLSGRRNLSLLRFPARGVLRRDLLL